MLFQRWRRQGRGQDVDEGIPQQHGADHALPVGEKPVDIAGGAIAVLLQLMHPPPADGGQRRLRTGKQGGDGKQQGNDAERGNQHGGES